MNAVYINKNNPDINFGQTGDVYPNKGYYAFLPHGGNHGMTLCSENELYLSGNDFRIRKLKKIKREPTRPLARSLAKKIWAAIPDGE